MAARTNPSVTGYLTMSAMPATSIASKAVIVHLVNWSFPPEKRFVQSSQPTNSDRRVALLRLRQSVCAIGIHLTTEKACQAGPRLVAHRSA